MEKEILHIEILRAMSLAGHLRRLVFKGGTCLRLCRGGIRLSEDLDFASADVNPGRLGDIEDVVRDHLHRHYRLEASVRHRQAPSAGRSVHRWMVRVITRPSPTGSTSNIGVQRVKIDVDSTSPTDAVVVRAAFPHRDVTLPSAGVMLRCVPVKQTLVDKLVALPTSIVERRNPRFRDIRDLYEFLPQQASDRETIMRDARLLASQRTGTLRYEEVLAAAGSKLPSIMESEAFDATMRRFLPSDVAERTIADPDYRAAVTTALADLFAQTRNADSGGKQHGESGARA